MRKPLLGYLDPDFIRVLDEVVGMLKAVYRCERGLAFPLSSTGTAGMEASLAALLEPGETVIVGIAGYFGRRIAEVATRHGARVVEVVVAPGDHVPEERLFEVVRAHPEARAVAVVQAETSTGVRQPLENLGAGLRSGETLLVADCVTSLGGIELEPERWGIDYCYSCTQKCLGAPPGMSPVRLSERALERIRARRAPLPFTFDFALLARYWVERPAAYHHTPPASLIYALHEALRLLLEEGLEARWLRHAEAGAALQAGAAGARARVPRRRALPASAAHGRPHPRGRRRPRGAAAPPARARHRGRRRARPVGARLAGRPDGGQRDARGRGPRARGLRRGAGEQRLTRLMPSRQR